MRNLFVTVVALLLYLAGSVPAIAQAQSGQAQPAQAAATPLLSVTEDWGMPPALDAIAEPPPELPPLAGWFRYLGAGIHAGASFSGE